MTPSENAQNTLNHSVHTMPCKKQQQAPRKNTFDDDFISMTTAISDCELPSHSGLAPPPSRRSSAAALPHHRQRRGAANGALSKSSKGDKKNTVKNFVKAFRSFLFTHPDEALLYELIGAGACDVSVARRRLDKFRSDWATF